MPTVVVETQTQTYKFSNENADWNLYGETLRVVFGNNMVAQFNDRVWESVYFEDAVAQ